MFDIGIAPPMPVSESSAAFTAPHDVTVVIAVHSAELVIPKRVSLPSRLPPAIPAACCAGEPWTSAAYTIATPTTSSRSIATYSAQPWRRLPTMRPNVAVRPAGMIRMSSISNAFVIPLGFSNGIAELTLKKPPPLVPSSLMTSCDATGPSASVDGPPVSVLKSTYGDSVWMTPCETRNSAPTTLIGSRMYSSVRIRSAQKLPSVFPLRRAIPRITAATTAMPTAAETKFWTASPAICEKYESVVSPA
jgi:hypothetical protein